MAIKPKRKLDILDGGIVFLLSVTLLLITNVVFALILSQDMATKPSYYYIAGIVELLAIGLPPIIYLLVRRISIKRIFGQRITKEQVVLSIFIAVFAYPILGFSRIVWIYLLQALNVPLFEAAMPTIPTFPYFLVAVFAISLIPGFSEEIVFRGIIQNTFQKKYKAVKAIMLSALFFMLMHGDISAFTYTFTAGTVIGLLYYYTGSLWATIIYHVVNNLVGVVINYIYSLLGYNTLIESSNNLFPQGIEMLLTIVVLLVIAAVCFGICFLLFWALKKVTVKPEKQIISPEPVRAFAFVPYIVGGVLMLIVAIIPIIAELILR